MNDLNRELGKIIDGKLSNDKFQRELAKYLNVSMTTIYYWVGEKFKSLTNKRDLLIYKLHMLGWAGPEIAKQVENSGLEQSYTGRAVNLRLEEVFSKLKKLLIAQFESKKPIPDIVKENEKYYGLDETLVWAIALQNKPDKEKLALLSGKIDNLVCEPQPFDVWPFTSSIPLQLLYFCTKQGDLVVDLMAGSGQMIDACLLMNRQCRACDVNTSEGRNDIQQSDAVDAVKKLKKKADLFFLKLPSFKDRKEENSKSATSFSRGEYLDYISGIAISCKENLKPSGEVAFLSSDYITDDLVESIFVHQLIELFERAGFVVERIVQCPLPVDQISDDAMNKYVDARKLCSLARYLVILHKGGISDA